MQRCWSLQQQGVWIGTEADWLARVAVALVSAPATPATSSIGPLELHLHIFASFIILFCLRFPLGI